MEFFRGNWRYCRYWSLGKDQHAWLALPSGGGGGYCEGYGFQSVYSRIGYINQSVSV